MARISDFGGNGYGTGRTQKIRKETTRSLRCLHCDLLFYMTHAQAARAGKQHCPKCGGPGEETEPSFRRRVGLKRKEVASAISSTFNDNKPNVCRLCHKAFRTSVALKLHYEDLHSFAEQF